MSATGAALNEPQVRYRRLEHALEVPMMVLSLLIIPVVLMPITEDLSPASESALEKVGLGIWAGFAVEYTVLMYLSPDRRKTFLTHKLDLALVLLPFLRPLRMARILRLAQAGTAFTRLLHAIRMLGLRPGFAPTLVAITSLVVVGGGFVAIAENGQPDAKINGFGDGLWWAIATCTTVGYGDAYPVTATGRVIAVVLMLAGICALSVVTANVAAYFVMSDRGEEADTPPLALAFAQQEPIQQHLDRIEAQLADIVECLPHPSSKPKRDCEGE